MENWKLMDFYFPSLFPVLSPCSRRALPLLELFPCVLGKCSDGVLNRDWKLEVAVEWGEVRAWLFEMQKECLCSWLPFVSRCWGKHWAECCVNVTSFQSRPESRTALLCSVFLHTAIYWDQLWLERQTFMSEPLLVFIKTSYAWALSIWSFYHCANV